MSILGSGYFAHYTGKFHVECLEERTGADSQMPCTGFRKQSLLKTEMSPEKQPNVRVSDSFVFDTSGCGYVLVWEKVDGNSTYFCTVVLPKSSY